MHTNLDFRKKTYSYGHHMPNGKLVKTLENGEIGIGIFIDFENILMRWTALFDCKYCSFIVSEVWYKLFIQLSSWKTPICWNKSDKFKFI